MPQSRMSVGEEHDLGAVAVAALDALQEGVLDVDQPRLLLVKLLPEIKYW